MIIPEPLNERAKRFGAIDAESRDGCLLILDLDETLIHAGGAVTSRGGFRVGPWAVMERPGARKLLAWSIRHFQVAVWTTATRDYARAVLQELGGDDFPFAFVWCRDRCTFRGMNAFGEPRWRKDLKKVRRKGWNLARVLMVEDRPEVCDRHYGNVVPVSPFVGDPKDAELEHLRSFLLELKAYDDVRRVEKRNWQRRYIGHRD